MSENSTDTGTTAADGAEGAGDQQQGQMVPQSEVDRIVRERVARERAKYADYDDLKVRAGNTQTLEERLASLESELTTTRTEALRTGVAARFGISTEKGPKGEPSDADLFLTGSDDATLTAQAQRLAGRAADRKRNGNVAPNEGDTKTSGNDETGLRDFTKRLFGEAD
jgi:hypothetical protein